MKKPTLSDEAVRRIRRIARHTDTTYLTLGKAYGVSESLIGKVVRGDLYRYVPDDEPQGDDLDVFLDQQEDEPDFQVGDVVRLRSGSPDMTIERIDVLPSGRRAVWACFWSANGPMSCTINVDTVERV